LNPESKGFDAYICHPQFGNGMVRGKFVLMRGELHFEWDEAAFALPMDQTIVELGDDENWLTLRDRRQPDLQFSVERAMLDDVRFVQNFSIRRQLESQLGRKELWRRSYLTVACLVAFVLLAWAGSNAMGWGVRLAVKGISVKHEMAFGDEVFKKIEPRLMLISDTNAVQQLETMVANLSPAVPTRGIPFKFYITVGEPNAFALPGGRIVVTTGLLQLLDTPEQLLGVLAHEWAHVTQRHAFQHMISGKGPIFLMQILTGGGDKMVNLLAFPSELLVYESFSQQYEKEADACGWDYLVAAKINPHGMIEMLQKLKQYESGTIGTNRSSAFDSHPDLDRRIKWLEAKWAKLPDKTNFLVLTNLVPKVEVGHDKVIKLLFGR
jgi:Zn-dependent protease with chaperone function